jgi:Tfp pilus assembly protein PilW
LIHDNKTYREEGVAEVEQATRTISKTSRQEFEDLQRVRLEEVEAEEEAEGRLLEGQGEVEAAVAAELQLEVSGAVHSEVQVARGEAQAAQREVVEVHQLEVAVAEAHLEGEVVHS